MQAHTVSTSYTIESSGCIVKQLFFGGRFNVLLTALQPGMHEVDSVKDICS